MKRTQSVTRRWTIVAYVCAAATAALMLTAIWATTEPVAAKLFLTGLITVVTGYLAVLQATS